MSPKHWLYMPKETDKRYLPLRHKEVHCRHVRGLWILRETGPLAGEEVLKRSRRDDSRKEAQPCPLIENFYYRGDDH